MLQRLASFLATGAPGASRLLVFFLVERLHGVEALGRFSSDIFLAGLLAFFSAVGWAGLVMIRVPPARGARKDQVALAMWLRSLAVFALAALALVLLGQGGYVVSVPGTVLWLFGWGLYQFARHDLFARRQPGRIVAGEAACLAATLSALWFELVSPYLALSLPFLAWGAVWLAGCARRMAAAGYRSLPAASKTWPNAMMMGVNNLLSGGLGMSVVPIARFVAGDAYAGFLGLLFSTLNIMLLFPRTMSLLWLPRLAVSFKRRSGAELDHLLGRFRRDVSVVVLGVGALACAAWFSRDLFGLDGMGQLPGATSLFLLVMTYFVLSQWCLPDASLLMAMEKVGVQFNGAVLNVSVYLLGALFVFWLGRDGMESVALVIAALCAGAATRNIYIFFIVRRFVRPVAG